MNQQTTRMFTGREVAIAYAISAERMFGDNAGFLDANPAVVPIFVSLLFQSLEISIKQAGVKSGLFTMQEVRARQQRSGHGIKELAALAVEKLGGDPFDPIVTAMTFANTHTNSAEVIRQMICGDDLEKTRESYASRRLGYGEVSEGDFAIIRPVSDWIEAVKETASNLPTIIDILSQWKASASKSKHFAIWLRER
jgi:hypothetical protein